MPAAVPAALLAAALAAGCTGVSDLVAPAADLPRGSYRDSCTNPRLLDERRLVAECPNAEGAYFRTAVNLPCFGDILNDNGRLTCDAPAGALPEGPFRTQCRDERLAEETLLAAECRDRRNRWVQTSLRLPCNDVIRVEDGRLMCGFIAPAPGIEMPKGSFLATCANQRIAEESILLAECPDSEGRVFETRLRLPCAGDVANEGGQLVCRP